MSFPAPTPTPESHIAHTILSQAYPPPLASSIFTTRVQHKPLILRPTSPDPTSHDARASRRLAREHKKTRSLRRQKPRPLSAKEKRDLGIYDIPREQQRYGMYEPLHRLWVGYMWEILGLEGRKGPAGVTGLSVGPQLCGADFHGAEVEVVRSSCAGRVGCRGIVLKDTRFTFVVVTRGDALRSEYLERSVLFMERVVADGVV